MTVETLHVVCATPHRRRVVPDPAVVIPANPRVLTAQPGCLELHDDLGGPNGGYHEKGPRGEEPSQCAVRKKVWPGQFSRSRARRAGGTDHVHRFLEERWRRRQGPSMRGTEIIHRFQRTLAWESHGGLGWEINSGPGIWGRPGVRCGVAQTTGVEFTVIALVLGYGPALCQSQWDHTRTCVTWRGYLRVDFG